MHLRNGEDPGLMEMKFHCCRFLLGRHRLPYSGDMNIHLTNETSVNPNAPGKRKYQCENVV